MNIIIALVILVVGICLFAYVIDRLSTEYPPDDFQNARFHTWEDEDHM